MKSNHRQSEIFDSLRAGLHVEHVDFKDTFTPELVDRENGYWEGVIDALEEQTNGDRATCNRLRILRRQVLNGECRTEHWGLSHVVAGTAAGVALFLGVSMWWDATWTRPEPATTQTASVEWNSSFGQGQPVSGTQTVSLESSDVENVEFANNIDFYTWLEKQSDTVAGTGGS